jgi:hypothetical protein
MATAASEDEADRARWVEDGGAGHLWAEAVRGGATGALGGGAAVVGPLDRIALQRSCDTAKVTHIFYLRGPDLLRRAWSKCFLCTWGQMSAGAVAYHKSRIARE